MAKGVRLFCRPTMPCVSEPTAQGTRTTVNEDLSRLPDTSSFSWVAGLCSRYLRSLVGLEGIDNVSVFFHLGGKLLQEQVVPSR